MAGSVLLCGYETQPWVHPVTRAAPGNPALRPPPEHCAGRRPLTAAATAEIRRDPPDFPGAARAPSVAGPGDVPRSGTWVGSIPA
ncbi:MAG: hypothetical protein HW391_989 [Chloroflexi bacterium]|nr:hypothetical protein [Chloroflexota bacterium]